MIPYRRLIMASSQATMTDPELPAQNWESGSCLERQNICSNLLPKGGTRIRAFLRIADWNISRWRLQLYALPVGKENHRF